MKLLTELAQSNGKASDPLVRQDLMKLYTLSEIARYSNLRLKGAKAAGKDIPGLPNIAKLTMSDIVRQSRDLGLRLLGPAGTLHAYDDDSQQVLDAATGNPVLNMVTTMALYAQAPPIYGGTDQIQRNILGERVLGLPKEPGNENKVPFSQLPKNA